MSKKPQNNLHNKKMKVSSNINNKSIQITKKISASHRKRQKNKKKITE